jgi:hypothetical protein
VKTQKLWRFFESIIAFDSSIPFLKKKLKKLTKGIYTLAGFDLTAHNFAAEDDNHKTVPPGQL